MSFRNESDDHLYLYIRNLETQFFGTQYTFEFVWDWAGTEF